MQDSIGEIWLCAGLMVAFILICAVRTICDRPKNNKNKK